MRSAATSSWPGRLPRPGHRARRSTHLHRGGPRRFRPGRIHRSRAPGSYQGRRIRLSPGSAAPFGGCRGEPGLGQKRWSSLREGLRHLDPGGKERERRRVNDDQGTNSQVNPAIALDQSTGDVAISWYDARNDLGNGGPGDTDGVPNDDVQIWASFSTDGGVSLAPNFQVSQGTSNANGAESFFDYGDYTHAAFQSHAFYPAWSDNSNSTGDNPDGKLHQLDLFTAKVVIA